MTKEDKEFPQTEEQEKIYNFWRIRGYPTVKAILGNLNVSFHRDNPKYEQNGLCFQYLEQFYHQAKEEVFDEILKLLWDCRYEHNHFDYSKNKAVWVNSCDLNKLKSKIEEMRIRHLPNSKGSPSENSFNKDLEVTATPTPKEFPSEIPSLNPNIKRNFSLGLRGR